MTSRQAGKKLRNYSLLSMKHSNHRPTTRNHARKGFAAARVGEQKAGVIRGSLHKFMFFYCQIWTEVISMNMMTDRRF